MKKNNESDQKFLIIGLVIIFVSLAIAIRIGISIFKLLLLGSPYTFIVIALIGAFIATRKCHAQWLSTAATKLSTFKRKANRQLLIRKKSLEKSIPMWQRRAYRAVLKINYYYRRHQRARANRLNSTVKQSSNSGDFQSENHAVSGTTNVPSPPKEIPIEDKEVIHFVHNLPRRTALNRIIIQFLNHKVDISNSIDYQLNNLSHMAHQIISPSEFGQLDPSHPLFANKTYQELFFDYLFLLEDESTKFSKTSKYWLDEFERNVDHFYEETMMKCYDVWIVNKSNSESAWEHGIVALSNAMEATKKSKAEYLEKEKKIQAELEKIQTTKLSDDLSYSNYAFERATGLSAKDMSE
jgi:hypothetical protein